MSTEVGQKCIRIASVQEHALNNNWLLQFATSNLCRRQYICIYMQNTLYKSYILLIYFGANILYFCVFIIIGKFIYL